MNSTQEFPLKRLTNGDELLSKIISIYNRMCKQNRTSFTEKNISKQDLQHFIGLIIVENVTIKRLGLVSDYFQEQNKIIARRYDEELSPYEYWLQHPNMTRDEISMNVKEVTNFCGTILCKLIKIYRPKHILDFCSGWGDRLFASIVCNNKIKSFYGIDPNESLQDGYKEMIDMFVSGSDKRKYNMICGCAEKEIRKLNQTFDLIFTSPPYFDLEVYSSNSSQSIGQYPAFDNWYENFLMKCILDSIDKLNDYGILAININNTKDHNIVDRLIHDVTSRSDKVVFDGIIYYGDPKNENYIYQPILVWRRL